MQFVRKLYQLLFVWRIPTASFKEMATAHAIVTQAWSRERNGEAGPGNEIIARIATELSVRFQLPILTQEEVTLVGPSFKPIFVARNPKVGGSISSSNWNTYVVAKMQFDFCKDRGWSKVILVAMPVHMGRATSVYQKLGVQVLVCSMPKKGYYSMELEDPTHWFSFLFQAREILVRLLFWYWGYL